jgi:molybdopterin synthase sulfur carrier subunit
MSNRANADRQCIKRLKIPRNKNAGRAGEKQLLDMSVSIHIPTALRCECRGSKTLNLSAPTVRAALEQLAQTYPSLYRCVCDETDSLRPHINLFVNWSLVHRDEGLDTALESGDELAIMTAVSGG